MKPHVARILSEHGIRPTQQRVAECVLRVINHHQHFMDEAAGRVYYCPGNMWC